MKSGTSHIGVEFVGSGWNEQSRDPGNIGHKTKDEEKKTQDRKIPIE
jgi:hypothetical protein